MKRRAIIVMVCDLRKKRDMYRKWANQCADAIQDERDKETKCYIGQNYIDARTYAWRCAGMLSIQQNHAGKADGFHKSAHMCLGLLNR